MIEEEEKDFKEDVEQHNNKINSINKQCNQKNLQIQMIMERN